MPIFCILNKLRGTSDECRSKSMSEFRQRGTEFLSVLVTSCPEILCINSSTNRAYISPFLLTLRATQNQNRHQSCPLVRICFILFLCTPPSNSTMPHLLVDPNTAQCPNYNLDIYQAVRAPFVTPDLTHKQAAILNTVWNTQNAIDKQQLFTVTALTIADSSHCHTLKWF